MIRLVMRYFERKEALLLGAIEYYSEALDRCLPFLDLPESEWGVPNRGGQNWGGHVIRYTKALNKLGLHCG